MTDPERPETPFVDRLGAHLARAAREQAAAQAAAAEPVSLGDHRKRRRGLARALAMAAVVLAVVGLGLALFLRGDDATVDAVDIERVDRVVTVTIVDLIEDPDATERALRDAGIDATLTDQAAAPQFVGKLTGGVLGDDAGAEFVFDDEAGEIVAIELRGDYGPIELHYGREAEPGEGYVVSGTYENCAQWRNRRLSEVAVDIGATFDALRWKVFDSATGEEEEVAAPAQDLFVQNVVPLSERSALILLSDQPDALPSTSPTCE